MKKVCILVGYYPVRRGGAEFQAYLLAQKIKKEFNVFFVSCGHTSEEVFYDSGIKIYTLRSKFNKLENYHFLYKKKLIEILKAEKPDIVYVRYITSILGLAANYCKKFKCKLIWHIAHDMVLDYQKISFNKRFAFEIIEKEYIKYGINNNNIAICQTYSQSKILNNKYNVNNNTVISNYHPKVNVKIEKSNKKFKILWIANYKKIKRPDLFFEFVLLFKNFVGIEFIMIGRQPKEKYENKFIHKITNIRNLKILGEIPIEKVNILLSEAHVLVCTSEREGFPNTFIQAWLREVVVLSLFVDPDNILKKKNIGFHSNSIEQMYNNIEFLVKNENKRREMGKRARLYAEKQFDMKNNIDKIINVIKKI